jgi:hypothetical protein
MNEHRQNANKGWLMLPAVSEGSVPYLDPPARAPAGSGQTLAGIAMTMAEAIPSGQRQVKPKRKSSAVSSGRRMFVQGDSSSAWSRRYRDICASHVSDLGGRPALSESEYSLIKRCSTLEIELEQMEGKLSMGQEIDLDLFQRTANSLRRIFETLGLKRVARDVTPSLEIYSKRLEAAE